MLKSFLSLSSLLCATSAFADDVIIIPGDGSRGISDGYCNLAFDDDNRNGIGSIEGYCVVFTSPAMAGKTVRLRVRGLDRRESRSYTARVNRYGEAEFLLSHSNARDWRSRNIRVSALTRSDRMTIFRGFLHYN